MAEDEKIKIDWDDINRPEVEARVEQERRFRMAAAHYQRDQQDSAAAGVGGRVYGTIDGQHQGTGAVGGSPMQFLYKPWAHAGLAGLLLAFVSWAITEPIPYFSDSGNIEQELIEYLEKKGYTLLSLSQESAPTQELVIEEFRQSVRTGIYVETMLWFGIIGAAIGAGLCSSEHLVGRAYEKALKGALIGVGGWVYWRGDRWRRGAVPVCITHFDERRGEFLDPGTGAQRRVGARGADARNRPRNRDGLGQEDP